MIWAPGEGKRGERVRERGDTSNVRGRFPSPLGAILVYFWGLEFVLQKSLEKDSEKGTLGDPKIYKKSVPEGQK